VDNRAVIPSLLLTLLVAGCARGALPRPELPPVEPPRQESPQKEPPRQSPPRILSPQDSIPDSGKLIRTDKRVYRLERVPAPPRSPEAEKSILRPPPAPEYSEFRIIARFENRTGKQIFLNQCRNRPMFSLEKRTAEGWVWAYEWGCVPSTLSEPPTLAPGAVQVDTLLVRHYHSPNWSPIFRVPEIPGTYRLVYHYERTWPPPPGRYHERLAPIEQRISNSFVIEQ
jgi:hypothetical protein